MTTSFNLLHDESGLWSHPRWGPLRQSRGVLREVAVGVARGDVGEGLPCSGRNWWVWRCWIQNGSLGVRSWRWIQNRGWLGRRWWWFPSGLSNGGRGTAIGLTEEGSNSGNFLRAGGRDRHLGQPLAFHHHLLQLLDFNSSQVSQLPLILIVINKRIQGHVAIQE